MQSKYNFHILLLHFRDFNALTYGTAVDMSSSISSSTFLWGCGLDLSTFSCTSVSNGSAAWACGWSSRTWFDTKIRRQASGALCSSKITDLELRTSSDPIHSITLFFVAFFRAVSTRDPRIRDFHCVWAMYAIYTQRLRLKTKENRWRKSTWIWEAESIRRSGRMCTQALQSLISVWANESDDVDSKAVETTENANRSSALQFNFHQQRNRINRQWTHPCHMTRKTDADGAATSSFSLKKASKPTMNGSHAASFILSTTAILSCSVVDSSLNTSWNPNVGRLNRCTWKFRSILMVPFGNNAAPYAWGRIVSTRSLHLDSYDTFALYRMKSSTSLISKLVQLQADTISVIRFRWLGSACR